MDQRVEPEQAPQRGGYGVDLGVADRQVVLLVRQDQDLLLGREAPGEVGRQHDARGQGADHGGTDARALRPHQARFARGAQLPQRADEPPLAFGLDDEAAQGDGAPKA